MIHEQNKSRTKTQTNYTKLTLTLCYLHKNKYGNHYIDIRQKYYLHHGKLCTKLQGWLSGMSWGFLPPHPHPTEY